MGLWNFFEKNKFLVIIFDMKKFFIVLILFIGNLVFADENCEMRNYGYLAVPSGSFIQVMNTREISTEYCDEGAPVKFISTTDMYMYETNVVPSGTEFYGYIYKKNEPIIGTNASLMIRINKMRYVDGYETPMRGYIYSVNGNLIGGELTPPAKYDKKVSARQGERVVLGYVPGATRQMGVHKVIAAGADMIIVLVSPLAITHTVTN